MAGFTIPDQDAPPPPRAEQATVETAAATPLSKKPEPQLHRPLTNLQLKGEHLVAPAPTL
ncbi:hypothetical protein GQ600_1263 [Phytophthora cactorum]|nr:hypothetical protein GQ600_1263 [Phytophthora cactorum]